MIYQTKNKGILVVDKHLYHFERKSLGSKTSEGFFFSQRLTIG